METLASFFKALADPTRLRILYCLRHGELCVCDIMAALDMPQSTISRHLTTLKHAKLVQGRRCGKWMYYKQDTPDNMLAEAVRRLLVSPNTDLALSAVVQGDTCQIAPSLGDKNRKTPVTDHLLRYDYTTIGLKERKYKVAGFRARTTTRGGPWTPVKGQ